MIVLTMLEMFYKPWMMIVNMVTSTSSLIIWLTFCSTIKFNPYLLFKFLIFLIILVCLFNLSAGA